MSETRGGRKKIYFKISQNKPSQSQSNFEKSQSNFSKRNVTHFWKETLFWVWEKHNSHPTHSIRIYIEMRIVIQIRNYLYIWVLVVVEYSSLRQKVMSIFRAFSFAHLIKIIFAFASISFQFNFTFTKHTTIDILPFRQTGNILL